MSLLKRVATPAQCRAARALLNWTQTELATRAGVARKTIADFELSRRTLHKRTLVDITVTLEEAGVELIVDGIRLAGDAGGGSRSEPSMGESPSAHHPTERQI